MTDTTTQQEREALTAAYMDACKDRPADWNEIGYWYFRKAWDAARALPQRDDPAAEGKAVAWMDEFGNVFPLAAKQYSIVGKNWKPLYTTPPSPSEARDAARLRLPKSYAGSTLVTNGSDVLVRFKFTDGEEGELWHDRITADFDAALSMGDKQS